MKIDNQLSNHKKLLERAKANWLNFQEIRRQRLAQMRLRDGGAEKITEIILDALFTIVLDWPIANIDYQSGRCDMVLVNQGIKWLIVEAKYPGSFQNNSSKMQQALDQVYKYSETHNVRRVAVCDGYRLYAIDLFPGKFYKRVDVFLDGTFPEELWLLSTHGIYRPVDCEEEKSIQFLLSNDKLHPKYKLPASCFAYVKNPNDPKTWSLPYLLADGSVDIKRLPKAISAVISNYRGTKVKKIPDTATPLVLRTLEAAARRIRKMPDQLPQTADIYKHLAETLVQF